jgi:hypothetical protein
MMKKKQKVAERILFSAAQSAMEGLHTASLDTDWESPFEVIVNCGKASLAQQAQHDTLRLAISLMNGMIMLGEVVVADKHDLADLKTVRRIACELVKFHKKKHKPA